MQKLLELVVFVNFAVDFLLLLAVNRLCGFPAGGKRAAAASALGGGYAGACLLPGFSFLGSTLWRLVSLGLMGSIAFGWSRSAARRTVVFVLLILALGGMTLGRSGGFFRVLMAAVLLCAMCMLGFRGSVGQRQYVPVRLQYREKQLQLLALLDTGNALHDPVSGEAVTVIGARAAQRLTGLTPDQLAQPVQTLSQMPLPGLRLLPYRAVGSGGMLLVLRLDGVWIHGKPAGRLVAFAPTGLDEEGTYQALTGGCYDG